MVKTNIVIFRKSRVEMTLTQFNKTYGFELEEQTHNALKVHVYLDGFWILEMADGVYYTDICNYTYENKSREAVESKLWNDFVADEMRAREMVLPHNIHEALRNFVNAGVRLLDEWRDVDDDTTDVLKIDYPFEESFGDIIVKFTNYYNKFKKKRDV